MLPDSPGTFKAILSLSDRVARDPTLLRVLHALALSAGVHVTSGNLSPRADRSPMPASRPTRCLNTPSATRGESPRGIPASRTRAIPPPPPHVTAPRLPYTFTRVEGGEVRIYDAGLKLVARKSLQPAQPALGGEVLNASGTGLASLPNNSGGRPFVLLAFDVNHLHARACQAFPGKPVHVVTQIQRAILAGIPAGEEYFAFYFTSHHLHRLRREQLADSRHAWYIEQSIKGWGEDGNPRYADVDVPLAHVLTQILERYPGQVTRVVLGSGDKDHRTVCAAIRAAGIPLDIIAVAEADVSRELRALADRIQLLYP